MSLVIVKVMMIVLMEIISGVSIFGIFLLELLVWLLFFGKKMFVNGEILNILILLIVFVGVIIIVFIVVKFVDCCC